MEIIYRAFDGEEFYTKKECLNYETGFFEGTIAFDAGMQPLNQREMEALEFIDEAYYVKFETEQAAQTFNRMLYDSDDKSIISPVDYVQKGIYFWDEDNNYWHSLEHDMESLKEVAKLFEK